MKMTIFTLMAFFLLQSPLSANDKKPIDPLANSAISKEEVLKQIEELKKQGRISQADLDKAQKAMSAFMASQSDDDPTPLPTISISKEDILKSVEVLHKQGKISQVELDLARKQLSGLTDEQIQSMTKVATDIIQKDPEKFLDLMNSKKANTDKAKLP